MARGSSTRASPVRARYSRLSAPGFTGAILSALKIRLPRGPVALTVDGGLYIPEKSGFPFARRGTGCAFAALVAPGELGVVGAFCALEASQPMAVSAIASTAAPVHRALIDRPPSP